MNKNRYFKDAVTIYNPIIRNYSGNLNRTVYFPTRSRYKMWNHSYYRVKFSKAKYHLRC